MRARWSYECARAALERGITGIGAWQMMGGDDKTQAAGGDDTNVAQNEEGAGTEGSTDGNEAAARIRES